MLKHYDFIPFEVSAVAEGSVLVFAPHPDDETFGLGGTIFQMTQGGQEVNLVMMTGGAAGGDENIRKSELENACKLLGIAAVDFLAAADGDLQVTTEHTKKVIDLIEKYSPDNIFFPSPLEYHPDHRATAWLVWDALQSVTFAGNVFSYEIANQSPINTLVDISKVIDKKTEAMHCYGSQNEQLDYVGTITAMNQARAYTVAAKAVKYAEGFFKFPDISMDLMTYYYQRLNTYHRGVKAEKLPLVSVLVRTKDRPERLFYALESILKQTYQQLEINIVNDGGIEIQSLVDSFDFERVFVKTHEVSKGRAAAANALLRMVQGEYAIFLDDDDTFDADHIENLVKVIRQNENMLAAYSGIRVGEGINMPPFNKPYNAALLRRINFIPFHAVLFSSKLLEDGCKFDESLEVYEDWDFWLQVAQRTEYYHVNKITATYNINGQSGAGGAGGHALNEEDLHFWTLKVYEKWSKIWSAKQLSQTFQALATLNSGQVQDVKKKMQALTLDNNKKLKQRDESIQDLQKRLGNQQTQNKPLNHHIDQLLKERIREHDEGDSSKRDFELVSTRNYEAQCIELFEEVFKEKMSKEFWNWKYAPHGMKWRGVCVVKGGKVVGHYNGMGRNIIYFGQHKKAIAAGDTMVSPKARGGIKQNSPFYTMIKVFAMNVGIRKEFILAYGFPNKRHMILSEKVGLYKEVDTITEVLWKVSENHSSNEYNIEPYIPNDKTDAEILTLWRAMIGDFKDAIIGVRNRDYLKSRYIKHPKFDYNIYLIRDKEKKLISVFVTKQENNKLLLMDIISQKDNFKATVTSSLQIAENNECIEVKCWITTSKAELFNSCNANLKEIEVSIPTSDFTPGFDPEIVKDKWFLMYGDTDFI